MKLTEFQCLCKQCGIVRTFTERIKRRNLDAVCKPCSDKNRTKAKDRFSRECDTCFEIKYSNYKIKSTTCVRCSQKKLGARLWLTKDYASKTTYTYFCHYCSSVRVMKSKRKSNNCTDCARKHNKRDRREPSIYFDFKDMKMKIPKIRHYAYCEVCDAMREVQSKRVSGNIRCTKHRIVDEASKNEKRLATLKANGTKPGRKNDGTRPRQLKRTTKVSKESIDRARELNRLHKEAQVNKPKLITQTKTEEEMMAEYLEKNKITIVSTPEDNGDREVRVEGY